MGQPEITFGCRDSFRPAELVIVTVDWRGGCRPTFTCAANRPGQPARKLRHVPDRDVQFGVQFVEVGSPERGLPSYRRILEGGAMVRYRRSKKMGPFRITMSSRGISNSVGAGPFRITKGADGKVRRTIRIPGTGIYDTRVVSQSPPKPHKPASRKEQANIMQPDSFPPPQLPPAGWYADPTGEASLRYWDGRQWTPTTDAMPAALKQHQCPAAVEQELALAVGTLRAWRVIVAALHDDDDDAIGRILDELDGCVVCLKYMVIFIASSEASIMISLARNDKARAIAQAEKQLGEYIETARRHI